MQSSSVSRTPVILLCLVFTACTTLKTYKDPDLAADKRIRPGRTMVITTTDGEVLDLTSTEVSAQGIEGMLTYAASRGRTSAYATGRMSADERAYVHVPAERIHTLQMQGLDGERLGQAAGFLTAYIMFWAILMAVGMSSG